MAAPCPLWLQAWHEPCCQKKDRKYGAGSASLPYTNLGKEMPLVWLEQGVLNFHCARVCMEEDGMPQTGSGRAESQGDSFCGCGSRPQTAFAHAEPCYRDTCKAEAVSAICLMSLKPKLKQVSAWFCSPAARHSAYGGPVQVRCLSGVRSANAGASGHRRGALIPTRSPVSH